MNTNEEYIYEAEIFYYLHSKQYNLMINKCKESLTKSSTISFRLYKAMALMLNNRLEECINEIDIIKSESYVQLASTIALIYCYKMLGTNNNQLYVNLENQMKEYKKNADTLDFYHSSFVLFLFKKFEKALDYLEKSSSLQKAQTLKGWILLNLEKNSTNAIEVFKNCCENNRKNLHAAIGLIECYLYDNDYENALSNANKVIVRFPQSVLPLIAKMNVLFAFQNWDQINETINRILDVNPNDLDALKMKILVLLCHEANYTESVTWLKRYFIEIENQESKNRELLLENIRLFSRICDQNSDVLTETLKLVVSLVQNDSENVNIATELAYQHYLLNQYKDAEKYYKAATRVDSNSGKALEGLILCKLEDNETDPKIEEQLDFVSNLPDTKDSIIVQYCHLKIEKNKEKALEHLHNVLDLISRSTDGYYVSGNYLLSMNPDFLLKIITKSLQYLPFNSDLVTKIQNILILLNRICPGLYKARYLLAQLQNIIGESLSAMHLLDKLFKEVTDVPNDIYLLMAQIQIKNSQYERAEQTLEASLSNDFTVRNSAKYHYIKGLIEKNAGNCQDAINFFNTSLQMMGNENQTPSDKALIYTDLIDTYNNLGQTHNAAKLLSIAYDEFQGTSEETKFSLLHADHLLERKNVIEAINLLEKIKPDESYYVEAKMKLADIFLKYKMDKNAYLQCYQEMIEQNRNSQSYIILGDAYMNILEPDDALNCYNLAFQESPEDINVILKLGRAFVETHYFSRAVSFYKDALRLKDNSEIKFELASLYVLIRSFDKAETLLLKEIENENIKNTEDLINLKYKTKLYFLLAQTQEKAGNYKNASSTLQNAKENQRRIRKRYIIDQIDFPKEEIEMLVNIEMKLGEIAVLLKDNNAAIEYYRECLDVIPNNIEVLTELAKLYMQMNLWDQCQQVCTNILTLDPECEIASVLMADIAFYKIDFDMALLHFTQLVSKQPTNWKALARLIEIMQRTGNLNNAFEYITNAEKHSSSKDLGLIYCTALYQWYAGNLNSALRNFNISRQDQSSWGIFSIYNMIEICLNPNNDLLGNQLMENDEEYKDSRSMAIKTVDRLLKELKQRLESNNEDLLKYKLLTNFRLLATQEKTSIERALEDFISLASQPNYKDAVGPIFGMSTAYTLLKQSQRAKNQLKRVVKYNWTFEDADYLEKCWLLLADYYIQSAKFDVASDLLNKILNHNKAFTKASEFMGFICEKEQRHKDAANYYEAAWRYGGRTNPDIGYKLAFNLMKCKRYADAIDYGQQVLKSNPDYPRIKKDLLDKCVNNLRI